MEAVGEAVEAIKELRDPKWILDRRNSGKLFWRRESAASDKRCVKFRCDVEVLEFLKSEAERQDWSEDEDEETRRRTKQWDREIPPPSSFWGGVCALLIAAVLTYQWLAVWLRPARSEAGEWNTSLCRSRRGFAKRCQEGVNQLPSYSVCQDCFKGFHKNLN